MDCVFISILIKKRFFSLTKVWTNIKNSVKYETDNLIRFSETRTLSQRGL